MQAPPDYGQPATVPTICCSASAAGARLRGRAEPLSSRIATRPEGSATVQPTDTSNPDYFHRVVDCQWACPAHTDVPEYIRLIALGDFSDAYMVNRESNVFPGILGRVCDRPCEPACRRGRVEDKPVAICRLKRVAADHKDSVVDRLPVVPSQKNGKRIACIGAGPASLTVANDLLPLGYEVVILEQWDKPGGLMRTNIPAFRLPESVIDEEIGYITGMGAEIRYGHRVDSLKSLLAKGDFDAVFVGSGAPKGKELRLPGREEGSARIHIGIQWLESVAFKHLDRIGERVLIIGVGNTAMDCCRSSLRLGARDVKVMARKPRQFFKASDWELEDAEAENVEIVVNHAPRNFVVEDGRLTGMRSSPNAWSAKRSSRRTTSSSPSARRTRSRGSRKTSASSSTSGTCPWWTKRPFSPRDPRSSSAATRRSARRTSSGPWSTATRRRSRSTTSAWGNR
jgi:NADPH-dependent glutamate synthase beta subunit-like oxidoreductase